MRTPSSLLRQTNRQHSTALGNSNISIRIQTDSSQAVLSAEPAPSVSFPWQVCLWLNAAMLMSIKGCDEGLEAFETSWGLCFCCFEGRKKKWHVLFPIPFALPGTNILSGRRCALGEWWNVERRGCQLQPLPGVSVCMKVLVSKRPVRSVQFTQQVFDKRTLVSPTHPQTPSHTAANNTTKVDKAD